MAADENSDARDDLIADGVVKLIELHGRLPAEVSVSEFRARAIGHLVLYYRARYRKFVGVYRGRGKPGEDRVRHKPRVMPLVGDGENFEKALAREDADLLLLAEIEDFMEGYKCIYPCPEQPGTPLPSRQPSGGRSARQPWESRRSRPAGSLLGTPP
jgi:hypothetical protein